MKKFFIGIYLALVLVVAGPSFTLASTPESKQRKIVNRTAKNKTPAPKQVKASPAKKIIYSKKKLPKKQVKTKAAQIRKQPVKINSKSVKADPARLAPLDISTIATNDNILEKVDLQLSRNGQPYLSNLPNLSSTYQGKQAAVGEGNEFVFFSIRPDLQRYVKNLVEQAYAPHVAIVAMDPRTGAILAMADKSSSIKSLITHSGFPAASIFKIITTAAALEKTALNATSPIKFRGGPYTLERWNYMPDAKRDRRWMNLETALAKSCNPVFGRVALLYLSPDIINSYAKLFGFNSTLSEELPIERSAAFIPIDNYELSRTAAGFGDVKLSPIHAAALVSSIANGGIMPRPSIIDQVVSDSGKVIYKSLPQSLMRTVQAKTATRMLEMMESTTLIGTSRREFTRNNKPLYPDLHVAAKTGTLKGTDPVGLNNWFVATAPIEDPKIAVAVIVVSNGGRHTKAAELGRKVITQFIK